MAMTADQILDELERVGLRGYAGWNGIKHEVRSLLNGWRLQIEMEAKQIPLGVDVPTLPSAPTLDERVSRLQGDVSNLIMEYSDLAERVESLERDAQVPHETGQGPVTEEQEA